MRAIEFFSGIGAFAVAARNRGIEVVAAFDQSQRANEVYLRNFGLAPNARNLDSIPGSDIPAADFWWMSPPCTPFSMRGNRLDARDARAQSFLHLIDLIAQHRPHFLAVENVVGFVGSNVQARLLQTLADKKYYVHEFDLCSSALGTPMRRPRHFVLASHSPLAIPVLPQQTVNQPLRTYLLEAGPSSTESASVQDLLASSIEVERYGESYDIVDPQDDNAVAICFTSGYGRSQKVSGSLIKVSEPAGRLRRFAPVEILRLLGFPDDYTLPANLPLQSAWRLTGNSVDVRIVEFCLQILLEQ